MKEESDKYFGFAADPKSNPCFANQKRLHNPRNREAAFAFAFHDTVGNLFKFAHVPNNKEAFEEGLQMLKNLISSYEEGKS